jgi:hypothetical protein
MRERKKQQKADARASIDSENQRPKRKAKKPARFSDEQAATVKRRKIVKKKKKIDFMSEYFDGIDYRNVISAIYSIAIDEHDFQDNDPDINIRESKFLTADQAELHSYYDQILKMAGFNSFNEYRQQLFDGGYNSCDICIIDVKDPEDFYKTHKDIDLYTVDIFKQTQIELNRFVYGKSLIASLHHEISYHLNTFFCCALSPENKFVGGLFDI